MSNPRRYSLFHPIIMAFYSRALYRDVGQNWRGTGYFYLFLLLVLCWIPMVVQFNLTLQRAADYFIPKVVKEIPEVVIKEGEISINKPMPYIIEDEQNGQPLVIIDTSGTVTQLEETAAVALITKNQIMIRKNANETQTFTLPDDWSYSFDKTLVAQWLDQAIFFCLLMMYPVLLIVSYLYRIFQTLIYAAIGTLIFAKFSNNNLDYQAILRLSVVAITPAVIISTILSVLFISIPFEWLLYFILSMVYLIFAIHANRIEPTPATTEQQETR